jgi:drug/metabolite transporter (DMT)-like permease
LRAEVALLAVTVGWGASFVLAKIALGSLGPFTLLFLRFALATTALALAFRRRALALPGGARSVRIALGIGALLFAGFAAQKVGLTHTTPARSGFVTATYVAMTPILARVFLGRAIAGRLGVAVAAVVVGLFLLLAPDAAQGPNRGDLYTLVGALAFAGHLVALDRYTRELPSAALSFAQMASVMLLAAPLAAASEPLPAEIPAGVWGATLFLGLVCSAFAYSVQTWAQRHTSPTRAALIFSLESLFAALISVASGVEALAAPQWVGGLLVVGGVAVGQVPESATESQRN